ncbi:MAG TPA: hypothetical protein VHC73_04050 [Vitreimonas sp.]|nr:hypothetical protein [Vitreimonas sp.]
MAATAISIDAGASGLLRHRFVRAFAASIFVALAGIFIWSFGNVVINDPQVRENGPFMAVFVDAALAFFGLFLFSATVAVIAAVAGAIHRRLSALVLFIVYGLVFVFLAVAVVVILPMVVGLLPRPATAAPSTPLEDALMMFTIIVATLVLFEAVGWAWWQLRIPRAQYFAARGWRAPAARIYSTARQSMGMPAFVSNFGRGRIVLSVIYFLIAALNIGLLAVLFGPLLIFSATQNHQDAFNDVAAAGLLLGLLVLNAVGLGALLQRFASAQATRLYQKAREWDERPPVVFLRAFDQDAQKLKARARDPFVKFPAGCGESKTLDELLLDHASVYGPVIAIGDPRDPTPPLGAARIFVPGGGNEWQHVVTSLLGASSVVVMCPSTSEGVKWELDLIRDAIGRLKVIYLANPLLTTEQTHALFQRLAPAGEFPALKKKQVPVAAFLDAQRNWIVLTTSKPPCVQTYTVALNYALQSLLGMQGTPLPKQRRGSAKSPNPRAQAA